MTTIEIKIIACVIELVVIFALITYLLIRYF